MKRNNGLLHSFITWIYIAPLKGYYSEALRTLAQLKKCSFKAIVYRTRQSELWGAIAVPMEANSKQRGIPPTQLVVAVTAQVVDVRNKSLPLSTSVYLCPNSFQNTSLRILSFLVISAIRLSALISATRILLSSSIFDANAQVHISWPEWKFKVRPYKRMT